MPKMFRERDKVWRMRTVDSCCGTSEVEKNKWKKLCGSSMYFQPGVVMPSALRELLTRSQGLYMTVENKMPKMFSERDKVWRMRTVDSCCGTSEVEKNKWKKLC